MTINLRINTMRRIGWPATLFAACLLGGCNANKTPPPAGKESTPNTSDASPHPTTSSKTSNDEEKKKVIKKLLLSKENDKQHSVFLGTLQFDESNRATLTTEGSGSDVEQLKRDWSEVSSQPELTWKVTVPGVVNGEQVMRVVGKTVHPGDDTYPQAVLNTMERSYGYAVEIGD